MILILSLRVITDTQESISPADGHCDGIDQIANRETQDSEDGGELIDIHARGSTEPGETRKGQYESFLFLRVLFF